MVVFHLEIIICDLFFACGRPDLAKGRGELIGIPLTNKVGDNVQKDRILQCESESKCQ